ncbi:hypothetical protein [Billgrantia saliphila]|uniref:hypothetical protein n=1 Tax=Billgrantia saliphila TaxID=1848458 RepID=UPI0012DC9040|nr:hypothetical protein [Halomonas saliphila]
MSKEKIPVHVVIHDLVPKLKATERFVNNTLMIRSEHCYDPVEKTRLDELSTEFELEIAMIRLNLDHLLRRYAHEFSGAVEGREGAEGAMLTLDENEAVAIESIRRLYQRAHELQTGHEWNGPGQGRDERPI